jgi:16S rRNA (uracil1498-N3)-methyltransferase
MPRLFVPPALLTGQSAALDGEPHHYLTRVLRLRPGDSVTVFDGEGTEIAAVIEATDGKRTVLRLGARQVRTENRRPIHLLIAPPKGDRMDWVVQKTTELGIAQLTPVVTARTVLQPGAGAGRLRRWQTIAQEAARQCGRADLPTVAAARPLAEVLAELARERQPGEARLLAWEEETTMPLGRALRGDETAVTLLIGAEGGFAADEVAAARAVGFVSVGLGPRVLRSETAAIVAVTLTQAALGALG